MGLFNKKRGWLNTPRRKFWAAVIAQLLIMLAAIAGASRFLFGSPSLPWIALVLIACSLLGTFVNIALLWQKSEEDSSREDPENVVAMLTALHATLVNGGGKKIDNHGLRICLHVPDKDGWEQLVDYVGDPRRHGKGRRDNMSKGVVGKALRTGRTVHASLPAGTSLIEYVVNAFGFSREEARTLKDDCKSWIAVPVGQPGNVIAIIYCDSTHPQFFGTASGFRRCVLDSAVLGIAEYAENR